MDRRHVLAASGALAASALAGCLGAGEPTDGDGSTRSTSRTTTGRPATSTPDVDEERLAELAAGNAAFALDLHERLAAGEGGNLFLSPYSVSVALAMTYAGARGETETRMRETLRYTLGEDVHPAFADLRAALEARATAETPAEEGTVDAFRLAVANALWGRKGYAFADDFLGLLEEHYGTGLRRADFAGDPAGERERINAWVAERTADRVEDLLPPNALDPSTVLVLTNAVYFAAGWQFPFDPAETADATFTALDGTESTVPTMRQHLRANYARVEGAQAVELPYVGEQVSMVVLVPDEGGFEEFERALDPDGLFGIFEELRDASGDLRLPRFEYEFEVQLSNALAEMGMPAAFSSDADFGGMVESGDGPWIDEVYHDAFVSVDEEGTEAAAATAVVVEESAPQASFDLTVDRPFLFCIRDRPTDAVLFLGRVVDAGAAQ